MSDNAHSSAGVRASVAAELDWDPTVDSRDIKVTADRGGVTLRGTVRDTQNAAQRVYGVTSVGNCLTVRPITSGNAEDREVRTAVLHALMLDSSVPATINARVQNGAVLLSGTSTWNWQRDEAERVCAAVAGVLRVTNRVKLIPAPAETDIQQATRAAFRRSGRMILHDLSVECWTAKSLSCQAP
jgi:osmotically-inducible protein OsmY